MNFAFTPLLPGALNMEIDETLAGAYSLSVPTIRFFTWAKNSISLGRNQNPEKRLTLKLCKRDGLSVVKRPTGGKELLHGHDLCYSVIWPLKSPGGAVESRRLMADVNRILVASLGRFGIEARWQKELNRQGVSKGPCFLQADRGEITVDGKKLIASAQRVFSGAILQQGSMPLRKSSINLADYLSEFDGDTISRRLESNSTSFFEHADETIPVGSIVEVFKEEFELALGRETKLIEGIKRR